MLVFYTAVGKKYTNGNCAYGLENKAETKLRVSYSIMSFSFIQDNKYNNKMQWQHKGLNLVMNILQLDSSSSNGM